MELLTKLDYPWKKLHVMVEHQLRTTQQTHVSHNSDSGVVTSNSTFGSANNIFSTDGQTIFLLNGDELYSNTHVTWSGNKFLSSVGNTNVSNVTTTFTVTVDNRNEKMEQLVIFTISMDMEDQTLTLVRDNHYQFYWYQIVIIVHIH